MKKTTVRMLRRPRLDDPILVEGLPGVGYVGKLAVDHLLEVANAEKFAEILSPHFPYHVVVEAGGVLRPMRNELYLARLDGKDIVVWSGDAQPISTEGHYEVVERVLDVVERLGVKQIFTLGGYATGKYSEARPKVIGIGDLKLLEKIGDHGSSVERGRGPVIGTAGLLLGLGQLRGIPGVCLLGETQGVMVDHRAAQAVLEVLAGTLQAKLDMRSLEQRARMTKDVIGQISKEMEFRKRKAGRREEEEVSYIG